jgi:hypothetical protein
MWGKWTFVEIAAPARLSCLVSFSDELGGVSRHPMSATWPLQTLSVASFDAQGEKTLFTLRWSAYHATSEERQTFNGGHEGMRQGWGGTLDQLAGYLTHHS